MIAKILEIDKDGFVKVNINVLTIPELKWLVDNKEDHLDYFTNLYHLLDPESSYLNINEKEREFEVMRDFPIDESDEFYIFAKKKLNLLYEDPIKKAFLTYKKALETTNDYIDRVLEEESFSHGKDGNYAEIQRSIDQIPDRMAKFEQAEMIYKKKLSTMRGNKEEEMDSTTGYEDEDISNRFN